MSAELSASGTLGIPVVNSLRICQFHPQVFDHSFLDITRYIGGNINYMGGGTMNMEYPFENHPGHYHLWKPPSGYFPRGEAPPPYEEAVALAQAESLNSQCTVSVATTTHRTLPMTLCATDNSCDGSNITTNTTNLINININNSGNITAVAAGENHQLKNFGYVAVM